MDRKLSSQLRDINQTVREITVLVDLLEDLASSVIHLNDVDNLLEEIAGMPLQIQQARIDVGRALERLQEANY